MISTASMICSSLITSGGANLMIWSCVGFASKPFSAIFMHTSQAVLSFMGLITIALSNPLPLTNFIIGEVVTQETSTETQDTFAKLGISFTSYKEGKHIGSVYKTDKDSNDVYKIVDHKRVRNYIDEHKTYLKQKRR